MPLSACRLSLCLAIAAIPLASMAEDFVTAKGKTVAMPDISSLSCEQIEIVLAKIDATRYRENAPVNPDPADDKLFTYEQDLAHALFQVCVVDRQPQVKDETASLKQTKQ